MCTYLNPYLGPIAQEARDLISRMEIDQQGTEELLMKCQAETKMALEAARAAEAAEVRKAPESMFIRCTAIYGSM